MASGAQPATARVHRGAHDRQHQDGGAEPLGGQALPDADAGCQRGRPQASNPGPGRAIDEQDGDRPDDRPDDLADEVARRVRPGEAAGGGEADRDGRVVVSAGNLARDNDAGEEREPEPEGHEQHADRGSGAEA